MSLSVFKRLPPAIRDYQFLKKIGQGGMGSVYKARHRKSGQEVAIKLIAAEMAEDFTVRQRFEQEFRVANKLIHPNIVRVLDLGRNEATIYLVMEYVAGQSLCQRIERKGPLPEEEAILLITQVAQALDYAHKHLIVHRDVKPDNLLLTEDGRVKLSDFGLVKDFVGDRHLTAPLSTLGTTQYMAPEQWYDAKKVDSRSDIYSLAATLYVMVTGKMPFASCRSPSEVIQQLLSRGLKPPRTHVPGLSEEIDEAIRQAMDPEPAKRPASCLEFVKGLRRGRGQPPTVKPPTKDRGLERRASVRHPLEMGTSCEVGSSVHGGEAADRDSWPAVIQDISQCGFALILGRRMEVGATVVVDLEPPDFPSARSLQAQIVNVRSHSSGHWRIGCAFAEPLDQEEIRTLL